MILTFFLVFLLLRYSYAHNNDFIRDYFVYKRVRSAVGISCRNTINDFHLLRVLNALGMYTIIRKPDTNFHVHRFLNASCWGVGIFVDLHCPEDAVASILSESSKYRMYNSLYNWLILGTSLNATTAILNDTAYNTFTDVVISVPNHEDYDLYDVFNHCKYRGGSLNVTKFGRWNTKTGLTVMVNESKYIRRRNLHGMRLKMSGVIQYRPQNMTLEDYMYDINTRSLDSMHKFTYAMIMHMADLFNFSVHASEIIWWHSQSLNGAIFEILKTNDVDFGSNPRVMVSDREDYARLINAVWPVRTCFFLLSTPPRKIRLDVFTKPFANDVWYLVISFLGMFILVIYLAIKLEKRFNKLDQLVDALVLTIGIISQQGSSHFPNRSSGRIAVLVAVTFTWILYNYYSGSIVSVRLSEPFEKIEDSISVLTGSNIRIAAEAAPYINYLLQKSTPDSNYFTKKRWNSLPESQKYLPLIEGIKQVGQGRLAYHTDPNTAYPYIEKLFSANQICELAEIHLFKKSVMGVYVSHNGQFHELAKIGLLKMFSTGLRDRQIKYWSSRKPQCDKDTLSTRGITINEIAPAFILLLIGTFLAVLICLIENVVSDRSRIMRLSHSKININNKKNIEYSQLIKARLLKSFVAYLKKETDYGL